MTDEIHAAQEWDTNAQMIEDLFRLDYLDRGASIMDATFGRGTFWKAFTPEHLTAHDIRQDGVDFRSLPEDDETFDIVVFDPPYTHGGHNSDSVSEFNDRFGQSIAPTTWPLLWELMAAGLRECARVTKHRGHLITKSMPYVASGRLRHTPHLFAQVIEQENLGRIRDELIFIRPPGPNATRRAKGQLHARRNYSVLQVFEIAKLKGSLA